MRLSAVVALVLFAAIQQPNPNARPKEPRIQERDTQSETNEKQQEMNQVPTTVIQECKRCTVIEKCIGCAAEGNPNTQENKADSYDPRQDALYRAYLWATIVGVAVALLGIGAIYRQTKATTDAAEATRESAEATARSAKATERGVKLEEDSQRPWIELRDWRVFRINPTDPLEIEFNVANPTKLPIDLHGIIVTIDEKRIDEDAPVMLITPTDPLLHGIGVPLTKEQEADYIADRLHFEIDCTILFADWHRIHWRQEIGCRLLCGRNIKPIFAVRKNRLAESGVPGESGSREVELP